MLRAVIIDDEPKVAKSIQMIIEQYCPSVTISGTGNSALEGIRLIQTHKPELVFLDIEMPNGNGFEMLDSLPDKNFDVIFITAYNQYAIKAFKYSAVDYLLKPVDIDDLKKAIEKVELSKTQQFNPQKYNVLLENIKSGNLKKVAIPLSDGLEYMLISEILYLEAERSYCRIHIQNRKPVLVSRSLSDIEALIDSDTFFRTHKSFLVNMEHVKKFIRIDGGYVELKNGEKVEVSRRKKDDFVQAMNKYLSK